MRKHFFNNAIALLGAAAMLTVGAARANAGLIVSAPDITVAPGSTGTFDILLTNTGPSDVSIGGFQFEISTTNPGILFTDATINTVAAPYIFGSDTLFGPDIAVITGTELLASDNPASVPSYSVAAGATVALGDVSYSVAANSAIALFPITFSPTETLLSDASSNDIPIDTLTNGSINVVPEPGSAALALLGLAGVVFAARRKV